jgi:hypothetical protein
MDTPRKLTFWPALKRGRWFRCALEHSSGYCLEPFAVHHLQAPQFARGHSEHPPVPHHYDQRHATDEHAGRGEMQEIHDVVKRPAAANDEATDQQDEERGRREPVDGSLGHGEALDPSHETTLVNARVRLLAHGMRIHLAQVAARRTRGTKSTV